jgi:hypothetical protein
VGEFDTVSRGLCPQQSTRTNAPLPRHRNLRGLRRASQDHCLHQGSGGDAQSTCYTRGQALKKILDHLKERAHFRMRFGYPRAAARHRSACSIRKNARWLQGYVAGDIWRGWRSAAGLVWGGAKGRNPGNFAGQVTASAEIGYALGREMAGLLRDGRDGFSAKRGLILPMRGYPAP